MIDVTSTGIKKMSIDDMLKKLPAAIQVYLSNAQDCIRSLPEDECVDLSAWRVEKLGKSDKEREEDTLPAVADILSAGRRAFCIGFCGDQQSSAGSFYAGLKEDGNGMHTQRMLQASFGMAQIAPLQEKEYFFESYGVCERVNLNEELLNQFPKPSEITASWVDALACTVFNKDCDIRLTFSPLDRKWVEEELKKAVAVLDELTKFQESGLQVSHSGGVAINETGHLGERVKEFLIANQKENSNESTSTSLNMKQEHWAVLMACEELQFRIRELHQMKRDGGWRMSVHVQTNWSDDLQIIEQIMGSLFVLNGYQCEWKPFSKSSSMILPSMQIVRYVHHPHSSFPGLEMEQLHNFEANLPKSDGPALKAGYLIWNGQEMTAENNWSVDDPEQSMAAIPLKDLNSHMFVCGKSGSGKTNSVCSLISSLEGIPFMVIEPVKGEYRSLKNVIPELQVFNLEIHGRNQLHMNPFWFPRYGKLNYHIDSLKSIIAASFELEAAMPDILEQCLVSSYVKKGWNISTNQNVFAGKLPDEMLYPTFSTLCHEVELYLDNAKFGEELKNNYKGALLSRLQSYTTGTKGLLLNCVDQPPLEEWIRNKTRCVIELDELADDSDKAIVMGTLLTQYFQCIKYGSSHIKPELKHVMVLEEAHHLFKDTDNAGGGKNNRQHLVEMLSNLLAEIRAYGEGVFIVDQSPTTVSSQVIKNTAVKLVHYTDYVDDLRILRECLLLDSADESAPASLKRGHALLRFSSMVRPVHVRMPLCETKENMGIIRERNCAADDAQNILDMIRMNRISRDKLRKECRKFMNHFIFDSVEKKYEALYRLNEDVMLEAVGFGYDQETLDALSEEGQKYILRSLIAEALPEKYPNQYLLCGRLQMVIERYLELISLFRNEQYESASAREQNGGITMHQNLLIEQYLQEEIRKALSFYYANNNQEKLNAIAREFPRSEYQKICRTELVHSICLALKKEEKLIINRGRKFDAASYFEKPAWAVVMALAADEFILIPDDKLCKELVQQAQDCWKLFE